MTVLVTGGAGYIGSVTAEALLARGRRVIVLDDLSTGHRAAVPPEAAFVEAGAGDTRAVGRLLGEHGVSAVLHFAARSVVSESVADPALYWRVNVGDTLRLLQAMEEGGVRRFIFSSTASVYGGAGGGLLTEKSPLAPQNPYGATKAAVERVLGDFTAAYGWRAASLRYFNAAGASPERGEDHRPERHLIPRALGAARGESGALPIHGTDYPTPDGTCVRDYIHVCDLADAHVLALEALESGATGGVWNLGNGRGFSVREVIDTVAAVTGREVPVKAGERRAGDPATLVAGAEKARRDLRWTPRHPAIAEIIASAARWREKHPAGYGPGSGGAS